MLLLVGMDGANPETVERLAALGRLPTMRALMRHGVYGRLRSSVNCNPISAWSSLLTGVNPGKHGAWGLSNLIPNTYEFTPPHARMLRAPTLSQILTDRGLEAGTLFVPMTYPAREAEWTTVSGWLCPSVEAEGFAWPARIMEMAGRRMEGVSLDVDLSAFAASGRYDAALDAASSAVRAKCELALEVLADRRWDMLAINFVEADRVQRWCWHVADPSHPAYREDVAARHGDCIDGIYVEADRAIGRLSAALGPEDQIMIVSTHGMGPRTGAATCVSGVLELLGLTQHCASAGGAWHRGGEWLNGAFSGVDRLLRALLPKSMANAIPQRAEPEDGIGGPECVTDLDYEHSPFLPAPGGHLILNLASEFPRGMIDDLSASKRMDEIARALSAAIDPANGRQPFEAIVRREDVCSGPYLNRIPHLIVRWRAGSVVSGMALAGRDGHVHVVEALHRHMSSGEPAPDGLLIAAGAGLRRSVRIEGAGLEDISATVTHLCGERVPSYFDGSVLEEALTPSSLAARPVAKLDREAPSIIEDAERSEQISAVVREHLAARRYCD